MRPTDTVSASHGEYWSWKRSTSAICEPSCSGLSSTVSARTLTFVASSEVRKTSICPNMKVLGSTSRRERQSMSPKMRTTVRGAVAGAVAADGSSGGGAGGVAGGSSARTALAKMKKATGPRRRVTLRQPGGMWPQTLVCGALSCQPGLRTAQGPRTADGPLAADQSPCGC